MRCIAVLVLAGCVEQHFTPKPLPPLAPPPVMVQAHELVPHELGLATGDHWIWDVQARGFSVGRVELNVGETEIVSRFRTNGLASAFAQIEHDLVTVVDRASARPQTSSERYARAGKTRQFSTQFAGTTAHSFHSALGALRTWANPNARPIFLHVVHADQMYRLELVQPVASHGTLRVEGIVTGPDTDPLRLTIWLDDSLVPTKLEVRDGEDRVTAQLITD